VPPLRELNHAFTSAQSPDDLMTAYYVASKVVGYMVERFGFDKIPLMLRAFGRGKRIDAVVNEVLGVDIDQLDRDFRAHTHKRLARFDRQFHVDFSRFTDLEALQGAAQRAPQDADAQAALAAGYVVKGQFEEAGKAGSRALELDKHHALAHFVLTRVALERRQLKRAERCLRAIIEGGQDGYIVRLLLARGALAMKRPRDALVEVEAAVALDPERLDAYRVLLDIAEKLSDDGLARRALTAMADLDQHDRMAHFALMTLLNKDKNWQELVRVGENALYVDPENPQVHRLLGEAYEYTDKPKLALRELDRSLSLGHPRPGKVQLLRARALTAMGERDRARKAAAAAVAADPSISDQAKRFLVP